MNTELTAFERQAIAALVGGDHPVFDGLRAQLAVCEASKREFTGVGFYTTLALPRDAAPVPLSRRLVLSDANATMAGVPHGVGLALFVEGGLLDLLEGFTYDGAWPDEIQNYAITSGGVMHAGGSESDVQQIESAWVRPVPRDIHRR